MDLFPTAGFRIDIDGQLRPAGSQWDRGADERGAGTLDLAITKDDGQASAVPGTPISYAITVTNNGPAAVASVIVTDSVPPAILGSIFSTLNGTYNNGTGLWTFASAALCRPECDPDPQRHDRPGGHPLAHQHGDGRSAPRIQRHRLNQRHSHDVNTLMPMAISASPRPTTSTPSR